MKFLILFACCFVASFISTLLFGSGTLGAIPTLVLYGVAFAVAKALTTAWENHKGDKSANDKKAENSVEQ